MWLGLMKHKKNLVTGIPKGYELSYELRNIERSLTLPPITLHYTQKQVSQGKGLVGWLQVGQGRKDAELSQEFL